jgi:DNA polymerase-3 subunit gamma/tau
MSEPLAQKYRPRTFGDMIGQNLTANVLHQMVEKDEVPSALLFTGPSGTGKTTAARVLARATHTDESEIIEIDAASNGGVADVRQLIQSLQYGRRIVIYDEAHSITRDGWNALLKPVEEHQGTTFVFVTTEPNKIPVTVLSRLMEFEFQRVPPIAIVERLVNVRAAEKITVPDPVLGYIARHSSGNVRSALSALDQAARAGVSSLEEFTRLRGVEDRAPGLMRALISGDHARIFAEADLWMLSVTDPGDIANDLVRLVSDLLIIRSGGTLPLVGDALQSRKDLALSMEPERLLSVMKVIWDLKTRVRSTDDPGANVMLVLTLISEVLTRGRAVSRPAPAATTAPMPASPAGSGERMSLADLQKDS